jgi:PAS domain S-box-containing protein
MLYENFWLKNKLSKSILTKILTGVVLGFIGIILTLNPATLAPGILIDTQTILLSISGLFFGPIPTILAMIITGTMRISMGGEGMGMGLAAIISSSCISLMWRQFRPSWREKNSYLELLMMGLLVNLTLFILSFFLVSGDIKLIQKLLMILIFIPGTALLGVLMLRQAKNYQNNVLINQDNIERIQALAKMEESEQKFRNIYENSQEGIFQTRVDGTYVSVNNALARMYGFDSPEELMKSRTDISKEAYSDPTERNNFLRMMEEKGYVKGYEYEVKRKDGEKIWFYEDAHAVKDEYGQIKFFEGFVIDITQRKKADAEVIQKTKELEKLNHEKDLFFSIIAHDLRSPFNSFMGLTQIMAEELSSLTTSEIQKIAGSMRNSAVNLFRLLENLLQWSRIEQGSLPFDPVKTDLKTEIDESIAMVLESARNKEIQLKYNIPKDLMIYADSNMLRTIIRNIVSNAIKFTPYKGKIILEAKAWEENNTLIFIRDTGIGMPPDIMAHLFELEGKATRKGTHGEPSSGLGLLLCKEFITKHGGKIWVESAEGKGTTFYFTFPTLSVFETV